MAEAQTASTVVTGDQTAAGGTTQTGQTTTGTQTTGATQTTGTQAAGATAESKWPDTWRNMISPEEKHAKTLERFASPKAMFESYQALRQRFDSGEVRTKLAPDAKPEDVAQWRKENGIPETPDKYDMTLSDGLVIGDADKPIVGEFTKTAHEANMHPDQVKKTLGWYFKERERQMQERHEADENHRRETEDALRSEWGNEYRGNINTITALLDSAPEGFKENFISARLADGKALFNDPKALRWMIDIAKQINPAATVIPGAGANQASAIDDEIVNIEKLMGNKNSDYWKGPAADKMQARYRDLITARDRLNRKSA